MLAKTCLLQEMVHLFKNLWILSVFMHVCSIIYEKKGGWDLESIIDTVRSQHTVNYIDFYCSTITTFLRWSLRSSVSQKEKKLQDYNLFVGKKKGWHLTVSLTTPTMDEKTCRHLT